MFYLKLYKKCFGLGEIPVSEAPDGCVIIKNLFIQKNPPHTNPILPTTVILAKARGCSHQRSESTALFKQISSEALLGRQEALVSPTDPAQACVQQGVGGARQASGATRRGPHAPHLCQTRRRKSGTLEVRKSEGPEGTTQLVGTQKL